MNDYWEFATRVYPPFFLKKRRLPSNCKGLLLASLFYHLVLNHAYKIGIKILSCSDHVPNFTIYYEIYRPNFTNFTLRYVRRKKILKWLYSFPFLTCTKIMCINSEFSGLDLTNMTKHERNSIYRKWLMTNTSAVDGRRKQLNILTLPLKIQHINN